MKHYLQQHSLSRFTLASALAVSMSTWATTALAQPEPADPEAAAGAEPAPPDEAAPMEEMAPAPEPATGPAPAVPADQPMGAAEPVAVEATATADATSAEAAAVEAELLGESGAEEAVDELTEDEAKLSVYGFADFSYQRLLSERRVWNNYTFGYPSFYVGNFNLYLSSNLGSNWRSLSEVRFTYLPDGAEAYDETGAVTRTSTAYPDYNDYNRLVDVGGIVIERVWVEYAYNPLLTVRAGQWLTPYGIWNVDHGSPVIIGTTRPFIIGAEMFPAHQTGIQLHGTYGMDATQLGYHLTLSNGRGPVDSYKDFDKNKAVGWRLWLQQDTEFGTFVLGTSGYKGTYADRTQNLVVRPAGDEVEFFNEFATNELYDELSVAADFKWSWQGALVQGEFIRHERAYDDSGRPPPAFVMDAGPRGWMADSREWGVYGLAGYRFDFLGIMPYFGGEYMDMGKTNFVPVAAAFWGGLNVRPMARVVVKGQGVIGYYPVKWIGVKNADPFKAFITQVAWSF